MKKFSLICLQVVGAVVAVLLTAEFLLQVEQRFTQTPEKVYQQRYAQEIAKRIHSVWYTGNTEDVFAPPFKVFSNGDHTNEEKLKSIFSQTQLPRSGDFVSYDFLQEHDRAASTTYSIHTNALGYRGAEITKEKPEGTYRIAVLGSYQAFGHGVDDDETYPAQLEAQLNAAGTGVRYEVVNAGRHSATAIVGLARMKHELFELDPDLIILDYGFVDGLIFPYDIFPDRPHAPDSPLAKSVQGTLKVVLPWLDHSLLWARIWGPDANGRLEARIQEFVDTMQTMIATAQEHGASVILVRQLPALSDEVFQDIVASEADVAYVDVEKVFQENPPVYPHPSEWKTGAYGETWLAELDPTLLTASGIWFTYYPYGLDLFQLNVEGQRVVADALTDVILKNNSESP